MKQKVVIVEDEALIREMYQFKLENEGYEVKVADSSQAGLALIADFQPDIVLLDIMMPYETGDVTLKKLRATRFGKKLKVLLMTNTDMQNVPSDISSLNVKYYVIKATMTPRQVADLVKEALAND
jgi:DNA-binding response OmpR family regulator